MTSAAARKAWRTRRSGGHKKPKKSKRSKSRRSGKRLSPARRAVAPKRSSGKRHVPRVSRTSRRSRPARRSGKKKGKGMPENVKQYFRLISSGMGKQQARKQAGLPPKGKSSGRKKWGPGHPLWEYQHRNK